MIGLLDSWWAALRDLVSAHPALIGLPLAMFVVAGFVLKLARPQDASRFNSWIRIARYCHDCPFCDLYTQECSVGAKSEEKCGLIDKTAGMSFTVSKEG